MENNPVGWVEIYVQDMTRARKFYESVLKLQLKKMNSPTPDMEMFAFPMDMDRTGASGALVKMKGFPSGGNSTMVYFNCDDCAVEAARVVTSGGKIVREKMPIGEHGFIAIAHDTEGNAFGLHSRR